MKRSLILSLLGAILLTACPKREMDSHAIPRETRAYESVNAATLSKADLITHLETLIGETNAATAAGDSVEFHHLEAAITPTLEALEKIAATDGNQAALAFIATLKPIVIKLHQAGHDANKAMGSKLASVIATQGQSLIDAM